MTTGNRPASLFSKINQWRYRLYPYLQNMALDLGLLDGYKDYTRFIIIGRSRSGSNFLRGLLNSHKQIVVLGELFQNKTAIGWAYPGYLQTQRDLAMFRQEPVLFLETKVFKRFPRRVLAVGFKIFYYHAQDESWKPVWNYLVEQKKIKVVHIKRKNILRTHLSRKLANMTDTWVNTSGNHQNQRVVSLDYEECLLDFSQTREWENSFDQYFCDHEKIEVFYEDLARDHPSEMGRIQEFLRVEREEVKPQTFKQSNQPLRQAILNYQELKERFTGSSWEPFFEE